MLIFIVDYVLCNSFYDFNFYYCSFKVHETPDYFIPVKLRYYFGSTKTIQTQILPRRIVKVIFF